MNDPSPLTPGTRIQTVSRELFEHVRNLLTCATLLALGLVARDRSGDLLGSSLIKGTIGWGVIALATALALLNLWMGLSRLKQWKHWKLCSVVLLTAYVFIATRVMEVTALVQLKGN